MVANAQPIVVKTSMGPVGVVHNGNLTNAAGIRADLERQRVDLPDHQRHRGDPAPHGAQPARRRRGSLLAALAEVEGAYSLLFITDTCLIAARDPHGFRPLALGDLDGLPCFASESCAFDLLGARKARELAPGEIAVARRGKLESHQLSALGGVSKPSRCAFEHVYFARPDSIVFGDSVGQARQRMGARLAREAPAVADMVVPVPDSGLYAALGYSRESGLPFELGLTRNHYVGRTFIEPRQSIRNFGVKVKLNPVRPIIEGKRVVLIDDSIVRGTTSRKIVHMMREAGAAEVHLRISSPPTRWPCYYGIDTPRRSELIAAHRERRGDPRVRRGRFAGLPVTSRPARLPRRSRRELLHRLLERGIQRADLDRRPPPGRALPIRAEEDS